MHIMSNLLRQLSSIFPVKVSFFLQILQMSNSFSYKCLPMRQHSWQQNRTYCISCRIVTPIQPIIVTHCWGAGFCSVVDIFPTPNEQEGSWESFKPWLVLGWVTRTSSCPDRRRQPKESAAPSQGPEPWERFDHRTEDGCGNMNIKHAWSKPWSRESARCSWQMVAVLMSVWTERFCSFFAGKHSELY